MTKRMFIVDDEPSMIALCKIILQREGFTVVGSALDGVEAIQEFKALNAPADMVLLDHRMPRKNGIETMRELFLITPKLKILFISADASIMPLALEKGAAGFLVKPFKVADLINAIKGILHAGDGHLDSASQSRERMHSQIS